MKVMYTLGRDELARLPYATICTTREGRLWCTSSRRRTWAEEFTEKERHSASSIFAQARSWYLVKGLPDEATMSADTLLLWKKLGDFCASL